MVVAENRAFEIKIITILLYTAYPGVDNKEVVSMDFE